MNRGIIRSMSSLPHVPRTRGDEPVPIHAMQARRKCSPHPRG